jgi:hypothetical protein
MRSALATYHMKPSLRFGWHYHCHLVVEWDDVVDGDSLYEKVDRKWREVSREASRVDDNPVFARMVTGEGPALVGMKENTQLEFWDEPQDEVEKVLHYLIRDVLQGIEGWLSRLRTEEEAAEFCEFMSAAKRHRCYGKWRKRVAGDETEARDAAEEVSSAEGVEKVVQKECSEWKSVSSMDGVLGMCRSGSRDSMNLLQKLIGCTNRSKGVLFRLRKVVLSIAA